MQVIGVIEWGREYWLSKKDLMQVICNLLKMQVEKGGSIDFNSVKILLPKDASKKWWKYWFQFN